MLGDGYMLWTCIGAMQHETRLKEPDCRPRCRFSRALAQPPGRRCAFLIPKPILQWPHLWWCHCKIRPRMLVNTIRDTRTAAIRKMAYRQRRTRRQFFANRLGGLFHVSVNSGEVAGQDTKLTRDLVGDIFHAGKQPLRISPRSAGLGSELTTDNLTQVFLFPGFSTHADG